MLLVFAALPDERRDPGKTLYLNPDWCAFRWASLGAAQRREPLDPQRHPLAFPVAPSHGIRWRTVDYPEAREAIDDWFLRNRPDPQNPGEFLGQSWFFPVLQATKVGGRPNMIQGPEERTEIAGARYFATLDSVYVIPAGPKPYSLAHPPLRSVLGFGDDGSMYLGLSPDGQVRTEWECY